MKAQSQITSSRAKFTALVAAAIALTLATGAVYGRLSQRWGPPDELLAAANRLKDLPERVGEWKLVENVPMADEVVRTLQCAGNVNRIYTHQGTGQTVHMAIIVGPSGPTAVHTPEICYSSQAFEITQARERAVIGGAGASPQSLWKTTFKSRNVGADPLSVYYGWSLGGPWLASRSPRYEFGGSPLLYKIQLASSAGSPNGNALDDPCRDFFEALLQAYWAPADSRRPTFNAEDSR